MKVKVVKPFCDKYTGKMYKEGDIIEVTAKRFGEIEQCKFIRPVEETAPEKA